MKGATTGSVEDPVEYEGEEEEGDDMEELVIGLELGRKSGRCAVREETDVGGDDEEEKKGA